MDVATAWVLIAGTAVSLTPAAEDIPIVVGGLAAILIVTMGYVSVGALLAGRAGAARIAALLLAGGALFALVPFGFAVGLTLVATYPGSAFASLIFMLGPLALGPAYAAILPGLAIAFPDGHLPSSRWQWPVALTIAILGLASIAFLLLAGPVVGEPGTTNPLGILPADLGGVVNLAIPLSILAITTLGVAAVIVRYRRGSAIEQQQQRWFVGAILVAAVPFVLSVLPLTSGRDIFLVSGFGLVLVPVSIWIAVTRYRLYEIDRLINRTLVYVPLTGLLAGLYAASVALFQRLFEAVTGDTSEAAIVFSALILAAVFTPVRKWLEGIVDRRFKPLTEAQGSSHSDLSATAEDDWDARVAAIATRVVRAELDARGDRSP